MSFELKETEDNKKYHIEKLEDEKGEQYYFVHDKESGDNWFNASTLSKMFNVPKRTVYDHLKRYNEEKNKNDTKCEKWQLLLNLSNSSKPVHFYSFDAVTYFAYRTNTDNAIAIRDWINDALNEKYNHERGFTKEIQANTINKEQLKNGIRQKNRVIQKLYTCYDILKEINHNKPANMVYHDIKQESAEVDTLKDTFILLEKSEQILNPKQPTTQSQLVEDINL